jgi:hypothetical protein
MSKTLIITALLFLGFNGGEAAAQRPAASTAHAQRGGVTSVYTPLSGRGCTRAKPSGPISSEWTCRGVGGYRLLVSNDDERESITIIAPDGQQFALEYPQVVCRGAFCYLGKQAEWRVVRRGRKMVPIGLIARVDVQGADMKHTSYLVVAKITPRGICVTDRIAPMARANERARRVADDPDRTPCLQYTVQ